MYGNKYFFNQETLRFEKFERTFAQKLQVISVYLGILLLLAVILRISFDQLISSPKVDYFNQKNQNLRNDYQKLEEEITKSELFLQEIQKRDDKLYRSVFDLDPLSSSLREGGYGGSRSVLSELLNKAGFEFFSSKKHEIVASSPMVIKNDPTLMFTNAGMNQFKDIFLGNSAAKKSRITDSQKCLRVSGKHNDLEEVGHDTYHHTMFEMLGNWSFGDYFKKEAIDWAWEFLTITMRIPEERLYATVFEGSLEDNIEMDHESYQYWKKFLPEDHILTGSKKDNFWEMGETGPCGPCSEIHCDIRDDETRKNLSGQTLVNQGDPLLIEIWNLVFIQYNRKSSGSLELLPQKHVDTGMGFERLCMVVQKKKSNYDTDVFQPLIQEIAKLTGTPYGNRPETDIAMRVMADHVRAISFSIADGQLPSNVKAGYVIRRILRRAVRYSYTFLNQTEPSIYKLVPILVKNMGDSYPELINQQNLIEKVIREEENSFLHTLETGIRLLDMLTSKAKERNENQISGKEAFTLYDTYGFPIDLTQLILKEKNLSIDIEGFEKEMNLQKSRSKLDAETESGDWNILDEQQELEFPGYDTLEAEVTITRYRKITKKSKDLYQLVFNQTPFYAESGGQVGDTGYIMSGDKKIFILDTIKENNLVIHLANELPGDTSHSFTAHVNEGSRLNTENNHSATHLMHYALRQVLGKHVEQKGSLVHPDYLRFDFSHFQKVTDEEIRQVENLVNCMIRKNIQIKEKRSVPIADAQKMGAMSLFGEKYGDLVRVIRFDDSIELCGGTHVKATGQIGFFKILKESAIAAGIRRIEAITGEKAEEYLFNQIDIAKKISDSLATPGDPLKAIEKLLAENDELNRQVESVEKEKVSLIKKDLLQKIEKIGDIHFLSALLNIEKAGLMRDIAFQFKAEMNDLFLVLGTETEGKANLAVMISDNLISSKGLNASTVIRELSKEIQGSGGGQPFFCNSRRKKSGWLAEGVGYGEGNC